MSTSHLPYTSRQDRRARPYTSRPQNSPNSTRSFRKKCWTEEYEPEYKFNGFCTYSSVDRTHRIGSIASYAIPAANDLWAVPPITPQVHGIGRYFARIAALTKEAYDSTEHERQNFRDLFEGNILCYGISRTGPDTFYAYWAEIARVRWTSPTGERFPHINIILSRYITKFDHVDLAPIGRLCEPIQCLHEHQHVLHHILLEDGEQRAWNIPDPQAPAPAADEPITVDDPGVDNIHAAESS